jgi:serine/threonine protein phosphatase PrpC
VNYAIASEAAKKANEDRATVLELPGSVVIALADGAGGLGQGARAAQAWIDVVRADPSSASWAVALEELDADEARRGPGHTTAIAIELRGHELRGVSAGDSAAWIVTDTDIVDLLAHAPPKPLVGDGCMAYEIAARIDAGTLLVASDGLVKYASRDHIAAIARGALLDEAVRALVELVRLDGGRLHDDTTVVLCRPR